MRLDLDSLDALELMFCLENAFGGRVPQEVDTSTVRTVDDLCRFIGFLLALRDSGAPALEMPGMDEQRG